MTRLIAPRPPRTALDVLVELAERSPFGLFTLAEAARVGVSRFAVAHLAAEGALVREAPGLYRLAEPDPHPLAHLAIPQRYLEGVSRYRSGTGRLHGALTDLGALELLGCAIGVDDEHFALPAELLQERPTVALSPQLDARFTKPPFSVVHHHLERLGITRRSGIHTVDAAAALADVYARSTAPTDHLAVIDAARNRLGLSVVELVQRWEAMGTRGAARLLALEAEGLLEMDSDGERRAFRLLFEGQEHVPDCQVTVVGRLRADFAFIRAKVIAEYLGRAAHEGRWGRDVSRLHKLQSAGWLVILITAAMLNEHQQLAAHIQRLVVDRLRLADSGLLVAQPLPPQPPRRRPLRTV